MSPPIWDLWFSPYGRRNRLSYLLATILLGAALLIAFSIVRFFSKTDGGENVALLMFVVPAAAAHYLLTGQRLRDFGLTGWLALLWGPAGLADTYIHGAASLFCWIVLLTVPGTQGANRYGPDPLAGLNG